MMVMFYWISRTKVQAAINISAEKTADISCQNTKLWPTLLFLSRATDEIFVNPEFSSPMHSSSYGALPCLLCPEAFAAQPCPDCLRYGSPLMYTQAG